MKPTISRTGAVVGDSIVFSSRNSDNRYLSMPANSEGVLVDKIYIVEEVGYDVNGMISDCALFRNEEGNLVSTGSHEQSSFDILKSSSDEYDQTIHEDSLKTVLTHARYDGRTICQPINGRKQCRTGLMPKQIHHNLV
jgi:hypothetical protein